MVHEPAGMDAVLPAKPGRPRIHRWVTLAFGAIFLSAAGLVVAAVAAGLILSAPSRATVGLPPADLNAERIEIPSASSATLAGWFIAGRPGGGAVVLMHGIRANRLSM